MAVHRPDRRRDERGLEGERGKGQIKWKLWTSSRGPTSSLATSGFWSELESLPPWLGGIAPRTQLEDWDTQRGKERLQGLELAEALGPHKPQGVRLG